MRHWYNDTDLENKKRLIQPILDNAEYIVAHYLRPELKMKQSIRNVYKNLRNKIRQRVPAYRPALPSALKYFPKYHPESDSLLYNKQQAARLLLHIFRHSEQEEQYARMIHINPGNESATFYLNGVIEKVVTIAVNPDGSYLLYDKPEDSL
jgi:hypothetical protein